MLQLHSKTVQATIRRNWRIIIVVATLAFIFLPVRASAQKDSPLKPVTPHTGVQIVMNEGEPELRVDDVPFFIHAAQFDYFRIPPDLWGRSLDRYRELGINTIDLRIPWNWHELRDAEFDFDGSTNPRRNLRGLLQLIAEKHLKFIARPGPLIGDHWRNAGYPAWLLEYSDYKMSASDIERGMAPADAELALRDGNAAARSWLANETHMSYARRWLTAIARELAPFNSRRVIFITEPGEHEGETQQKEIGGPLLFVALDDAISLGSRQDAPDLARYLAELRGALARGGLNAASYMNMPDVATGGTPPLSMVPSADESTNVSIAGEWFYAPPITQAAATPVSFTTAAPPESSLLTTSSASSLAFFAHSLGTQANFPPLLSTFAATTFAPGDDVRAAQPSTDNMLLASRLLLGNGIRGITYSPLQDTITPAGWEIPSAARYFRWDAALDLAGNPGPRANGVSRNGQFISVWGAMLAASHPRADFGIVDLRTCLAATNEATNSAQPLEQIFRVAGLAGFAPELVNPAAQSVERLLRDSVILLPSPEQDGKALELSEKAQTALVEFVRRGGTLVYFPARPTGKLLEPLWAAPTGSPGKDGITERRFERGHVIASSNDFYSWVSLGQNLDENLAQPASSPATEALTALLERAGAHRSLRHPDGGKPNADLVVTQLIPNQAAHSPALPETCLVGQLCAAGLVSVTNLSKDEAASESLEIADPRPAANGTVPAPISIDVTVPARESLLLPIHAPLCAAALAGEGCSDEVIVAGAELLAAERDGKTLELTFYAPTRAMVRLHLESAPTKVELANDIRLDNQWKQETGELEVTLLRGAAPDYRRVLRVHLRYTPHVAEKPDPAKNHRHDSEYAVFDAIRFPLASDATIPSGPPLIAADSAVAGHLTVASWNHSDGSRLAEFELDGTFRGTGSARLFPDEQQFTRIRFQPNRSPASEDSPAPVASDGLVRGQLAIHSGRERASGPVLFVVPNDSGNAHYQHDFDRDGALDWALESSRLRLIVSPADGGRALALVDKSTGDNLITLGGSLHDFLVPGTVTSSTALSSGDFSFNRAYSAEWHEEEKDTGLRLTYQQQERSPAGLHVEKTMHFTAPETIEITYHVSVVDPTVSAQPGNADAKQSFISVLSIPVAASEDGGTRFCWQPDALSAPAAALPTAQKTPSEQHCELFVPSGEPISVSADVTHLDIAMPGRDTLAVEWSSVSAVIVPKNFSAQIEFVFPVPPPGGAPGEFTLRYTVGSNP